MGHNQAEELENLVKWRSKMKKAYIRTANYDLEKVFKDFPFCNLALRKEI